MLVEMEIGAQNTVDAGTKFSVFLFRKAKQKSQNNTKIRDNEITTIR